MGLFSSAFKTGIKAIGGEGFAAGMGKAFTETGGLAGVAKRYLGFGIMKDFGEGAGAFGALKKGLQTDLTGLRKLNNSIATDMAAGIGDRKRALAGPLQIVREAVEGTGTAHMHPLSIGGQDVRWTSPQGRAAFHRNVKRTIETQAGGTHDMAQTIFDALSENKAHLTPQVREALEKSGKEQSLEMIRNRAKTVMDPASTASTILSKGKRTLPPSATYGSVFKTSMKRYHEVSEQASRAESLFWGHNIGKAALYTIPSLAVPIMGYRVARGKPFKGGLPIVPMI